MTLYTPAGEPYRQIMRMQHLTRASVVVAAGLVTAAVCAPASAQIGLGGGERDAPAGVTEQRPLAIESPATARTWLYYLVMVVGGVATIGVAIMPSKRTHQD